MSKDIYKLTIPEEVYGLIVEGIDLQILSSDSVRIVEAYIVQEGELSEIQVRVLQQCHHELQVVILNTKGLVKYYFTHVEVAVREVIAKISKK